MTDAELLKHLRECRQSGIDYRDQFKTTWEEIEYQIRCIPPKSWDFKEDWQTKIYIPLQAKKREIAKSYLKRMLFGKKRNFDITGVEREDNDDAQNLTNLIDVMMQSGNFDQVNDFVLQEGIDIGTGFIKMSMKPDGTGLDFVWRSPYSVLIDPECGQDIENARFIIDLYRRDIAYVIESAKKDKFGYDKEVVDAFLQSAALEAQAPATAESNKEPTMIIKGIDGTQDIIIPSKYKTVDIDEYWVKVPNKKGELEFKRIVLLNQMYVLSENENTFGFFPFQWCRVKPRKYDSYGMGYIDNTRGLQDLMNSMVCLGFDSLKISSMDIIVIDDNKVKDSTTIKYKPLAVWKMKDVNAVQIRRTPTSAIMDVLNGITLIDRIDQDASGIARQAQGSPDLGGSGAQTDTLGEYQMKMQMLDQRFLDVGRFIENDYYIPLIVKIFRVIVNPKLFDQSKVDRLIGTKEVDDILVEGGVAKKQGTKQVPKLALAKLRSNGTMAYDFKAVGITQFSGRLEVLSKLKEALQAALSNPVLTSLTKIDKLWNKIWQTMEIDDYQDLVRTPEEARELTGQPAPMQSQQQLPGAPPQIPQQPPQGMGGM